MKRWIGILIVIALMLCSVIAAAAGFVSHQAIRHTFYGVVQDNDGRGLQGGVIQYLHFVPSRDFMKGTGTTELRTIRTDSAGRFHIQCPSSFVVIQQVRWRDQVLVQPFRIQLMNDSAVPKSERSLAYRPNPLVPFRIVMPIVSSRT